MASSSFVCGFWFSVTLFFSPFFCLASATPTTTTTAQRRQQLQQQQGSGAEAEAEVQAQAQAQQSPSVDHQAWRVSLAAALKELPKVSRLNVTIVAGGAVGGGSACAFFECL